MTWQRGTANDYQLLLTALVNIATGNHAVSATVGAGGTGYSVGDILSTVGGTHSYVATFKVATLSGSAVATVTPYEGGAYTVNPTNPASTTVAPAGGTGCTLNLTMAATGWTAVRNTTPGGEKEVILQGVGSGSDSIFVGIKTYQVVVGGNTAYNWTLVGMTGFNSGLAFENQPGVSPGGVPASTGGAYVPLKTSDGFPISFWISVTGRRIVCVFKIEDAVITHFASCYLGFLNPFGTTSEFPYPIYVAGSTARHDCLFNTTNPSITGLTEMIGLSAKTGPGYLRLPNSTWPSVRNSFATDTGSPSRSPLTDYLVYPCGKSNFSSLGAEDQIVGDGIFNWESLATTTGVPGTAAERLMPTPDSGGDIRWLVPATVTLSVSPDYDIWGELDSVFWVSQAGGEANDDSFLAGGSTYRMFQNGNRTQPYSFMAIKEG